MPVLGRRREGDARTVQDAAVLVLVVLLGYLFGSFPTAYLIVKYFTGKNILEVGSANVGTLNVLRATSSKVMTAANLLGDVGKGVLAIVVGYLLADATGGSGFVGGAAGGIASVVGHNYTPFLKFQGGKGIATSLPVLCYLEPWLVPVWIATFFVTVGATRLLVLGQIIGTVVTGIAAVLFFGFFRADGRRSVPARFPRRRRRCRGRGRRGRRPGRHRLHTPRPQDQGRDPRHRAEALLQDRGRAGIARRIALLGRASAVPASRGS